MAEQDQFGYLDPETVPPLDIGAFRPFDPAAHIKGAAEEIPGALADMAYYAHPAVAAKYAADAAGEFISDPGLGTGAEAALGAFGATPLGKAIMVPMVMPGLKMLRGAGKWGSPGVAEKAEEALRKGADPFEVFRAHGYYKDPTTGTPMTALDGRNISWEYNPSAKQGTLASQFDAPELYAMDPSLKNVPLSQSIEPDTIGLGGTRFANPSSLRMGGDRDFRNTFEWRHAPTYQTAAGQEFVPGIRVVAPDHDSAKGIAAHEVQHLLNNRYGLPEGSSVDRAPPLWNAPAVQDEATMLQILNGSVDNAPPSDIAALNRKAKQAGYLNDPGEVAARRAGINAAFGRDPRSYFEASPFSEQAAKAHGWDFPELPGFEARAPKPGDYFGPRTPEQEKQLMEALTSGRGAFASAKY